MNKNAMDEAKKLIEDAQHIVVLQAENPDGDSLSSSLALESILGEMGKAVTMFCTVDVPGYLSYLPGHDRVTKDLPNNYDALIMVDATDDSLLPLTLEQNPSIFTKTPVVILDHHGTTGTPPKGAVAIINPRASSASQVVHEFSTVSGWNVSSEAQIFITTGILSDTGNFTNSLASAGAMKVVSEFMDQGMDLPAVHALRRQMFIKQPEIVEYKGKLLQRIEYLLDGKLAIVRIPWSEIEEFSPKHNPSLLVIDEMIMTAGVEVAIAIKVYDERKYMTAKIRANKPIANKIAADLGGGGHPGAAGTRAENLDIDSFIEQLSEKTQKYLANKN